MIGKTLKKKRILKRREPVKKMSKESKKDEVKLINDDLSTEPLNDLQELFCRYYTQNKETRGHGTLSYNAAYNQKLEEQDRENGIYEEIRDPTTGVVVSRKTIKPSSYDVVYARCAVGASTLLRKFKIQSRNIELLNEFLRNDIVDARLSEIIVHGTHDEAIKAIKEFNQLKGRITEKIEQKTELTVELTSEEKNRLLSLLG